MLRLWLLDRYHLDRSAHHVIVIVNVNEEGKGREIGMGIMLLIGNEKWIGRGVTNIQAWHIRSFINVNMIENGSSFILHHRYQSRYLNLKWRYLLRQRQLQLHRVWRVIRGYRLLLDLDMMSLQNTNKNLSVVIDLFLHIEARRFCMAVGNIPVRVEGLELELGRGRRMGVKMMIGNENGNERGKGKGGWGIYRLLRL